MNPHIYHPHADDEIRLAGDQAEQLAGDTTASTSSSSTPPAPTVGVPILVAIAKEETEVYRRHLAGLVELWDALGVMGLVCARQDRVTEFLAKLHQVKSIVKR